jgi:hypothetical protein
MVEVFDGTLHIPEVVVDALPFDEGALALGYNSVKVRRQSMCHD